MKAKLINQDREKTYALIFDTGDEVLAGLQAFAGEHQVTAAQITAIGAFSSVTLGFYDWERKDYIRTAINEQVEVLSMIGDIALQGDQPKVHAHVVVGKSDAAAYGGHIMEAHVRPTLEVILTESPEHLRRRFDPESGLALISV